MKPVFTNCYSGIISNCGCNQNIYQFDWKIVYDSVLAQLEKLRAENAELKAKLEKKTTPPPKFSKCFVWNAEERPERPSMLYSFGELSKDGSLKVCNESTDTGAKNDTEHTYKNWEEIEIKVKE